MPDLVPLATVAIPADHILAVPIEGMWQGMAVEVRAVLTRTAVVEDRTGYRHVVPLAEVFVDPTAIRLVQMRIRYRPKAKGSGIAIGPPSLEQRQSADRGRRLQLEQAKRRCAKCRRGLGQSNQGDVCTACRSVCPECQGPKTAGAKRCRVCQERQQRGQPAA